MILKKTDLSTLRSMELHTLNVLGKLANRFVLEQNKEARERLRRRKLRRVSGVSGQI